MLADDLHQPDDGLGHHLGLSLLLVGLIRSRDSLFRVLFGLILVLILVIIIGLVLGLLLVLFDLRVGVGLTGGSGLLSHGFGAGLLGTQQTGELGLGTL